MYPVLHVCFFHYIPNKIDLHVLIIAQIECEHLLDFTTKSL